MPGGCHAVKFQILNLSDLLFSGLIPPLLAARLPDRVFFDPLPIVAGKFI